MPDPLSEWFDPGELTPRDVLATETQTALAGIIAVAFGELDFYRELWERHGITAPVADLGLLPTVRKADIVDRVRQHRSHLVGLEALDGQMASNLVMTTGTMGFNTFAMLTDGDLIGGGLVAQQRELWGMKVRPGMRVLSVSPAWHALGLYEVKALETIGAHPVLPWGSLTPRFVSDLITTVTELRPEHVLLTVRAIRMILQECAGLGLDTRRVFESVRYIGCAGEPLSVPFRRLLVDTFEVEDVFERGGSGDGMFGGGECFAHGGHHISADVHHVEILSPDTGQPVPDGERGVAVVTNLTTGRSVYIRFDTEDVASVIPGACPCGRTSPVIEFHGRLAESAMVGGRHIATADVRFALDEIEATRFRPFAMQAMGDAVEVAVPGVGSGRATAAAALAELLGVDVHLTPGEHAGSGWKGDRVRRKGSAA